jgi:hypothetical protein
MLSIEIHLAKASLLHAKGTRSLASDIYLKLIFSLIWITLDTGQQIVLTLATSKSSGGSLALCFP